MDPVVAHNVCAVILSGGNREALICDAIESVTKLVRRVLLVNTGPTANEAIRAARERFGEFCQVVDYPGEYLCCTDGRNLCLQVALEQGFDVALLVDTDERIEADPAVFCRLLDEIHEGTILFADAGDSYKKEKLFWLPATGHWAGPHAHEAFIHLGRITLAKGIRFWEVEKTDTEKVALHESVVASMRKSITEEPSASRWWYYLGDSLSYLGRHEEAVDALLKCVELSRWPEETNWAYYRAACVRHDQGDDYEAIEICKTAGLKTPELAWLCAFCLHQVMAHEDAIDVARKAIELAEAERKTERMSFANLWAHYEGPHDVIGRAARELGWSELEQESAEAVYEAHSERLRRLVA